MRRRYVLLFLMPIFITGCGRIWLSFSTKTLSPGVATQLVFSQAPYSETAAGSEIPVQIKIEDAYGNVVISGADSTATITLTLTSGSGPLNGTTTVTAINGVASYVFKGVNIASLGSGDVITATKSDETSSGGVGVLSKASSSFDVTSNYSWFGATATVKWLTTGGQPAAGRGQGMFDSPTGVFVDSSGNVYVADKGNAEIKKFNSSGTYIGWAGFVGKTPTGGASGCTTAAENSGTPGWCTGGIGTTVTNQTFFDGIWGDGTYLYVVSSVWSVVFRFDASTGAYKGWTGEYSGDAGNGVLLNTYTAGCSSVNTGQITPGWCVGSEAQGPGGGDSYNGGIPGANSITGDGTYLYVLTGDKIQRFNAATGAADGWVGNLGTVGGGTCGGSTNVVVTSWCTDATAAPQDGPPNREDGTLYNANGIYYDSGSSSLYVSNTAEQAVSKYTASSGAFAGWAGLVSTTPTGGVAGCTSTSGGSPTPGWCTGGSASSTSTIDGVNDPRSIGGDGTYLYVLDQNRINRYNISSAAYSGWIGNIGNSGTGSCGSTGSFTSGWCTSAGSTSAWGVGDGMIGFSYNGWTYGVGAVFADGSGNLWLADVGNNRISKYTASTGAFVGWSGAEASTVTGWQTSTTDNAGANTDNSFGIFFAGIFTDGTNLLTSDDNRISKYTLSSLSYDGWLGDVVQNPTGGAGTCTSTAPGSVTPGWCTGGYSQQGQTFEGGIDDTSSEKLFADGTYIYAVDGNWGQPEVKRYNESTGAFEGWIGMVNSTPTGGDAGCTSTSTGNPTPGWCIGGSSENSSASGGFGSPTAIYSDGTYLYVTEPNSYRGNTRVDKIVASTGQFVGWIGAISSSPTGANRDVQAQAVILQAGAPAVARVA